VLASGAWSGEVELGTGSDPQLAIDANNQPHVVYVADGKIAYRTRSGSNWSVPAYIESNFSGTCSKPDVDVDGNGSHNIL